MMSGFTGQQSDSAFPTDKDFDALRKRLLRHDQIVNGALPSTGELMSGLPPCRDDLQSDVMAYIDSWKGQRKGDIEANLVAAAELARAKADMETLLSLRGHSVAAAESTDSWHDNELAKRCDVWLAYHGDFDAKARIVLRAAEPIGGYTRRLIEDAYRAIFAIGITSRARFEEYDFGDSHKVLAYGMSRLTKLVPIIQKLAAIADRDGKNGQGIKRLAARQRPRDEWDLEEEMSATADTPSLDGLFNDREEDSQGPGLVVVPRLPTGGTSVQKDIRTTWLELAGRHLRIVTRGDVRKHRQELVARWPHASGVIDTMLGDLAATEEVRFRPTLLLGSPGSGKSSLARAICEQVGLPCELVSMAGLADSALMGTSAQWSTARESQPLQLIKRAGMASVGVIWDEIEKAAPSRHNGSALEALLPLLESEQARRYRDLALEVEVDLSAVSHLATANSLEGVPAPVRDRFRVLTLPEPTWEHIGPLTRQIIDCIAVERGVDVRWFPPLAEDELDLVRQSWPGGSIRKLTRIVRTIVDGRDRLLGRC